ncbi:GNAT family N-acetyltransferase [Limosilactobacillus mucosae]
MNFDRYTEQCWMQKLYGKYFWNQELSTSSMLLATYDGNRFVGALLADIKSEPKLKTSLGSRLYVKLFELVIQLIAGKDANEYDQANQAMLTEYKKQGGSIDGEIKFLVADPNLKGQGIGSQLLAEFERRAKKKTIYLYTDSNCTYQFYDYRGFKRVGQRQLDFGKDFFECYLYAKVCGQAN